MHVKSAQHTRVSASSFLSTLGKNPIFDAIPRYSFELDFPKVSKCNKLTLDTYSTKIENEAKSRF